MNLSFAHISMIQPYQVFFSIFIGLMPWNYFTVEGGQILSTITSKEDVIKPETYMRLAMIAVACLIPPIAKKFLIKKKDDGKVKGKKE